MSTRLNTITNDLYIINTLNKVIIYSDLDMRRTIAKTKQPSPPRIIEPQLAIVGRKQKRVTARVANPSPEIKEIPIDAQLEAKLNILLKCSLYKILYLIVSSFGRQNNPIDVDRGSVVQILTQNSGLEFAEHEIYLVGQHYNLF